MRILIFLFTAAVALGQSAPQIRFSRTKENLRGVSVVSQKIAWASGSHGTYVRTTDGRIWIPEQVPGAETLDFRGIAAFSDQEAFLMSSGPGELSRIYHTADAGRHWQLQFTNKNPKGFFDSIAFWDRTHGVVLGDPIPDQAGNLKFELLTTEDGETWKQISPAQLPPAVDGEGAFAASNSCLAILRSSSGGSSGIANEGIGDSNIWFATGGKVARVFHSPDRGLTWQVFDTPVVHGADSQGIFSISFRDAQHGVIAGGDYKHPEEDGPNLAFTDDGGKTWSVSKIFPQSYYSAVAYDSRSKTAFAAKSKDTQRDGDASGFRLFIVDPKFVYDFRPPHDPVRINPSKKWHQQFNAVSAFPNGGALAVGGAGTIAVIP